MPASELTLVISDDGSEKVVLGGEGKPLRTEKIADRPTKKLLDGLDDGVWLRIGNFSYRNDLGMWLIDEMVADHGQRFNAVTAAWIARSHRHDEVFALQP